MMETHFKSYKYIVFAIGMCKHMDLIQVCGHCEVQTNNEVTRRVHFKKKKRILLKILFSITMPPLYVVLCCKNYAKAYI